jgi:hypothetical protein
MSDARLALIGFLFHAPGLWFIGKVRLGEAVARENRIALGWTAVATVITGVTLRSGWAAVVAWTVGHFVWSTLLARAALDGRLERN